MPLTIDFAFGDTDLFGYVTPSGPTEIALGVGEIYSGTFKLLKETVDQEIIDLSFQSVEGPQIVVSLRSSVNPAPEPAGLAWTFNPNDTGQYSFYCINEEDERVLIGTLLVEDASIDYDITDIMSSAEIVALPGFERTLFVVRDDSSTSGPYETATSLGYQDEVEGSVGSFTQQDLTPPEGDVGPVIPFNSVGALIIENYVTSGCTITCAIIIPS